MIKAIRYEEDNGNSIGFVMGIVLLIVAAFLVVYSLLPAIRGGDTFFNMPSRPTNINTR